MRKKGRKPIPDADKKVNAGIWVTKKNLHLLKPKLLRIVKLFDHDKS